jgi:putrescine aminotransferase
LEIYEREDVIPRGQRLEGPLRDALAPLASHDAVGDVRAGTGLLAAVALSDDLLATDAGAVAKVVAGARDAGVIVRPLLGAVAVSPPLVVEPSHIDEIAAGLRAGLDAL